MLYFNKIPPQQFSLLGAILGILLTTSMDIEEQNSFGNFLVTIGQGILTSTAQDLNFTTHKTNEQKYEELYNKIDELNEQLVNIKSKLRNGKL